MAHRRALCVGINVFKHLPTATLQGCVNDAHDMAALLTGSLGFAPEAVTVLCDRAATRKAILGQLQHLVKAALKGEVSELVFTFSSHGTQVRDLDGDERDRLDEAFCPHDLAAASEGWKPDTIITDDELRTLFSALPETVTLEVFMDTCHSGTGLKGVDPNLLLSPFRPRPRWLPPPWYAAPEPDRALDRPPERVRQPANQVLWTGCRADQTSADATFDGRANGAFTYHFLRALREGGPGQTRTALRDAVRARLKAAGFRQIPQLETDAAHRRRGVLA